MLAKLLNLSDFVSSYVSENSNIAFVRLLLGATQSWSSIKGSCLIVTISFSVVTCAWEQEYHSGFPLVLSWIHTYFIKKIHMCLYNI